MCRCQNDDDYCEDWMDPLCEEPRHYKYVAVGWGVMLLLLAALWAMLLSSCASWSTMSNQQKQQAAIAYYQAFSGGLKMASSLLPADKQPMASAAIAVADLAVDQLSRSYSENAAKQAQVAIESANAVVGAAQ